MVEDRDVPEPYRLELLAPVPVVPAAGAQGALSPLNVWIGVGRAHLELEDMTWTPGGFDQPASMCSSRLKKDTVICVVHLFKYVQVLHSSTPILHKNTCNEVLRLLECSIQSDSNLRCHLLSRGVGG